MLIIIIYLIIKLTSVLINSSKDKNEDTVKNNVIVKNNEPKTYLNKVSKTDNYNEDIDKDIQNTIVKYMDSSFNVVIDLK